MSEGNPEYVFKLSYEISSRYSPKTYIDGVDGRFGRRRTYRAPTAKFAEVESFENFSGHLDIQESRFISGFMISIFITCNE